ncbi:MAG: Hypothetical protein co-occurring with PspA-like suppressor, partial [uncultured Nocardioides sp.]
DRPDPRRGAVRPRQRRAGGPQRARRADRDRDRGRRRGDVPHRPAGAAGRRAQQRHAPRRGQPRRVRPHPAAAGRHPRRGPRAAQRGRPHPGL